MLIDILSNSKNIIWIISVILTIVWYFFYIKDIYFWNNKPHFFSWFIWWIITLFIYLIQISNNSWAWSWMVLISIIMTFFIAFISMKKWIKYITFSDKISLFLAIIAICLWFFVDDKIFSLICKK